MYMLSMHVHIIGTTALCPEFRVVCISEASATFPVGIAMCTDAVESHKSTFQSSPLLYTGWGERADLPLPTLVPVLNSPVPAIL